MRVALQNVDRSRRFALAIAASSLAVVLSGTSAVAHHDRYSHVSQGAMNGNGAFEALFAGVSANGNRVFFLSDEQLVVSDTDSSGDVYERSFGTTKRMSVGAINGNGPYDAYLSGMSVDGQRVFISTAEKLVAADTDSMLDIYQRSNGVTTLVSTGPINGNGPVSPSVAP